MHRKALNDVATFCGITIDPIVDELPPAEIEEYIVRLLKAIHIPIKEAKDASRLLQHLREKQCMQLVDPVLVMEETEMPWSIPMRLPVPDKSEYSWTLTQECGKQHLGSFSQSEITANFIDEVNGQEYTHSSLNLNITLPCGYHKFLLHKTEGENQNLQTSLLLIVTPAHCYVPPGLAGNSRVWGLSVHPHAIRSRNNWGIGDFSDLTKVLSHSSEIGAGALHTVPLNCCSQPSENINPYSPSCRTMLNTLFINIEAMPDFNESDSARKSVHAAKFQAHLAMTKDHPQVDYNAVRKIKSVLYKKLWHHFESNHLNPETPRGKEFRRFQERGGDSLYYYGIFALLNERFCSANHQQEGWQYWPDEFKDFTSAAVHDFAAQQHNEIEYQQYLQWQAELQLAQLGRRSMELGLKVGLIGELPYSTNISGFDSWYYKNLLIDGALTAKQPDDYSGYDPAVGLPLFSPQALKKDGYRPLIAALQHSMRHVGALIINSMPSYFQPFFSISSSSDNFKTSISFPFLDIIAIIALESQRNHCMVIADDIHLLPTIQQNLLKNKSFFATEFFLPTGNHQSKWRQATDYPSNILLRSSPPFSSTVTGFWDGSDIAIGDSEKIFNNEHEKEAAIVSRASDRAHFLITLDHEGLLPENHSVDPLTVPTMSQALITALHTFMARTPAKLLLITISDLLGMEDPAVTPSNSCQQFWNAVYTIDLEQTLYNQDNLSLFKLLCRERGVGCVRPSVLAADRKNRQGQHNPRSFYRLQLNKDFTFKQASSIVPYLSQLGISHCYVSPILMARPGSSHCYDIIDHSTINPEIGTREDFENFLIVLEQHHLALILDIVPNHMGIGADNNWWIDVLENGETSRYSRFFDINWHPQQPDLDGRVLLPFLGDYYGKTLEDGELGLCFDANRGSFAISYHEHRFPISPQTYPVILGYNLQRLEEQLGKDHQELQELHTLINSFVNLPNQRENSAELVLVRHRNKEVNKRILARLCLKNPTIKQFIEENVIVFNGVSGKPESFDLLHNLLEQQSYRLAFWRVAADEINYRRFFDINDLAGLKMEDTEVFHTTHKLVLDMVATGKLDGLRIDHPDGLYNPGQYFRRLQQSVSGEMQDNHLPSNQKSSHTDDVFLYVVIEKILSSGEHIPEHWPVNGTTGYDFSTLLNGIFVNSRAKKLMTSTYYRFIGSTLDFDQLLHDSKRLIISSSMAGEMNVLASLLYRMAQANRHTRDFTFNHLRDGLIEIVCCLPVYRTYIVPDEIAKRDVQFIQEAVKKAKTNKKFNNGSVFDYIQNVLCMENIGAQIDHSTHLDFVMKFQQYSGPVMAKGCEDTAFYVYNRLLSLNEVGSDPRIFGYTVDSFHRENQNRFNHWPLSMLNSSTHDSKRSEDVRARINVLSELPTEWQKRVNLWNKQNRHLKHQVEEMPAPSKNDEYAFYQNLLGAWPLKAMDSNGRDQFIQRMQAMVLKSCRESKVHSSWTSPNVPYEEALKSFVENCLNETNIMFLNDFKSFQEDVAWFGMLNSLSQVFFKMLAPGIPDIYQGNELWHFCLVDPDNRRPINFQKRQDLLFSMLDIINKGGDNLQALQRDILSNFSDGRAKLYVVAQTLRLRNAWQDIFTNGQYLPLEVLGSKSNHLCAFLRKNEDRVVIAVAPRLFLTLLEGKKMLPLGFEVWNNTEVTLPADCSGMKFHNIFSPGDEYYPDSAKNNTRVQIGSLLQFWPVAMLKGTNQSH